MDKKYMVMFGSVIGFILVVIITVTLLGSCNKKLSNESIEKKMINAAKKYAEKEKIKAGTSVTVDAKELAEKGYMKDLEKYTDDKCSGHVKIYNNGGVMNYLPYLECTDSKYKTKTLAQKMIDDYLTADTENTNGGLYYTDGEYIFRGKRPRNYVKLGGKLWVVIKIDSDGDIKLLATDTDDKEYIWDNKYNGDTKSRSGENDYKTSYIREVLLSNYKKYKEENRKHMIAKDICIGKRAKNEIGKSSEYDCSEKIENEYVSLINPSDFVAASLDKDCNALRTGDCYNFNYLSNILKSTWTANAIKDNTYQAIRYTNADFMATDLTETYAAQIVIYISGDELYDKGNGTKESPYEFKNVK